MADTAHTTTTTALRPRRWRTPALTAALIAAGLVFAGCSTTTDAESTTTSTSTSTTTSTESTATETASTTGTTAATIADTTAAAEAFLATLSYDQHEAVLYDYTDETKSISWSNFPVTFVELGGLDIVVNNAGIVAYAAADEMTDEEWDTMIDINLTGPFRVGRAAIPHLKRSSHPVIINNSSVMGLRGGNRLAHYTASKHGLTGLTKAWAIELAPFGIRVLSIHPTGVNTPMNDGLAELEGATAEEIAERSAGNLLPGVPWIEPTDTAELVRWLVSDRARYADGAQIVLDAGLLTA